MAETTDVATTTESEPLTENERRQVAIGRVRSLSIFFVGAGVFAAAGFALQQSSRFGSYQLTYFAVGVAVGLVGLVLWLLTR